MIPFVRKEIMFLFLFVFFFPPFGSLKKDQLIELKTKMVKTYMNLIDLMHDSCQSI